MMQHTYSVSNIQTSQWLLMDNADNLYATTNSDGALILVKQCIDHTYDVNLNALSEDIQTLLLMQMY